MLSEQEKRKANKQLECAVNGAHELFLREMHPLFNLRSPPKKIPVKIKPFLDDAAYLSKTIGTEEFQIGIRKSLQYAHDAFSLGKEFKFDSWKEYLATREYLAAHETAHYLRVIANPIAFSVSK